MVTTASDPPWSSSDVSPVVSVPIDSVSKYVRPPKTVFSLALVEIENASRLTIRVVDKNRIVQTALFMLGNIFKIGVYLKQTVAHVNGNARKLLLDHGGEKFISCRE